MFRRYLKEKYNVTKAFYFIGFIKEMASIYEKREKQGYIMVYKDTYKTKEGTVKGNCDAELVGKAIGEKSNYDKAVIVSSDGDFASLVKELLTCNKLEVVLAPYRNNCSHLLKKAATGKIRFIEDLRNKIEFTKKTKETL